jgi:hypothetical protein
MREQAMAVSRPIPDDAPVTRMVLPDNEKGLYSIVFD